MVSAPKPPSTPEPAYAVARICQPYTFCICKPGKNDQ